MLFKENLTRVLTVSYILIILEYHHDKGSEMFPVLGIDHMNINN